MSDTEDDDFGGFEVADADSEPIFADDDLLSDVGGNSTSGPEVSAIPWLAASLQTTSIEPNKLKAEASHTPPSQIGRIVIFDDNCIFGYHSFY